VSLIAYEVIAVLVQKILDINSLPDKENKMKLKTTIRQYSVTMFIVCTFALSVAVTFAPVGGDNKFLILAALLVPIPMIVALVLAAFMGGQPFLRVTLPEHARLRWVLIALGIAFAARLLVSLFALLTGIISTIEVGPAAPVLVIVTYLFALFEEIGWRGFAVHQLVMRRSPFETLLIIGIPWLVIHIFFYLAQGAGLRTVTLVFVLNFALTTMVTWVYLRSNQRLWMSVILHGSQSVFGILNMNVANTAPDLSLLYSVLSYSLIAVATLTFDWRLWFARPTEVKIDQVVPSVAQ